MVVLLGHNESLEKMRVNSLKIFDLMYQEIQSLKIFIRIQPQIMGVAILAGVGFTMSIFIANLAFIDNLSYIDSAKIGILVGSLVSGVIGALVLKYFGNKSSSQTE